MGEGGGSGPLAEEAAKLFAAVQEWLVDRAGGVGDRIAMGSTECQLCPVCQLIGLLRAVQPDTVDHLADASMSLLAAVRSAVAAHERGWASHHAGHRARSEHIDID